MLTWTVVTRRNNRGHFRRTGFAGTWHEAVDHAQSLAADDLTVWYVPTDDTEVTVDSGARIPIRDPQPTHRLIAGVGLVPIGGE